RAPAQAGMTSAQNQLLGLGKEFNLANAAPAQLDIMPLNPDLAMTDMGMDLPLDGLDVLDGGEIQVAAPNERRESIQELRSRLGIAGAGARLDHRGTLPVLAHGLVIIQRRIGGDRNLGGARIGPQPQVDAKDIAVLRRFGQKLDK